MQKDRLNEIAEYLKKFDIYVVKARRSVGFDNNYHIETFYDFVFVYKKDTDNGTISEEKYNKVARILRLKSESKKKMLKKIDRFFKED